MTYSAVAEPRIGSYTYKQVLGAKRKPRYKLLTPPENALLGSLEAAYIHGLSRP